MKIGYCAKQHVPNYPVFLSGYPREEKTDKVHLPPTIASFVLEFDNIKIAFCVIDTILVSDEMVRYIRKQVAGQSDLPYENIHISATHTHSAPCIYKMNIPDPAVNEEWVDETLNKTVEVILNSRLHMQECECYFQKTNIKGIYGNRNAIHGIENKNAYIFSFCRGENVIGKFINLSCHNTVNSTDNIITSDLFGGIRKELEKPYVFCMITNGISGDISTRHYRQGTDCKEVDRCASIIANILRKQPLGEKIIAQRINTDIVCSHAYQNIQNNTHIQRQIHLLEEKKANHTLQDWDDFTLESYYIRNQKKEFYHFLESSILLVNSFIFITIPGEAVTFFDQYIRNRFPTYEIIFLGTTDGYAGYFVPKTEEDDFESQMAEVSVSDVWMHINRIIKHLEFSISTYCGNM